MKIITPYIVIFIIGTAAGMCLCRSFFHNEEPVIERADTLVVYDTIRMEKPAEVRYEVLTERVLVPVRDTIWKRDTLFVSLPLERKAYKEDDYYAEISGHKPSLDYIEVYPRTTTITKTEVVKTPYKNSIALGLDAGYLGALYIPLYLEYERSLHRYVGINARIIYDLPSKHYGASIGAKVQFGW
jgi:hypothetical protein